MNLLSSSKAIILLFSILLPTVLAAYTYDSVKIILTALDRKNIVNTNSILGINYTGITGAYLKDGQFNRSTNYIILSVNSNGYAYEK